MAKHNPFWFASCPSLCMGVRGEEGSRGEGTKRVREGRVRRERVRKGRVGRGISNDFICRYNV